MDRACRHLMQADGTYRVQEIRADGLTRIVSPDHPTYLAWLAAGGSPEVVAYVAPQPPSMETVKADKVAEVQALKVAVRDAGFLVGGVRFDSDPAARLAYLELAMRLQADPAFTTPWKASASAWVTMDAALYSAVEAAGEAHVSAAFARQAALDAAIAACETVDAVQSLDITTGWPEA